MRVRQFAGEHTHTGEVNLRLRLAIPESRHPSLPRLHPFDKKNKNRCALEVCSHAASIIFNTTNATKTKDLIRLGVPVIRRLFGPV